MQSEIWKPVPGYEGKYEVSNLGRIKSLSRKTIGKGGGEYPVKERIMKPYICGRNIGYLCVELCAKTYCVHRIVALAFIPNPDNKPEIDHINCNHFDNRIENLRWVTRLENANNPLTLTHRRENAKRGEYAYRYGKVGKENGKSKAVQQFDLKGKFVAEFESTRLAGKFTGICYRSISGVANGEHKTAGGYIWKYKQQSNN